MQLLHLTAAPVRRPTFYVGFWYRGAAKIIDIVLLQICLLPFDWIFGTPISGLHIGRGSNSALFFLVFCLYSAILESSKQQATIGKRMLGILVMDLDEGRISFPLALIRSVMQYLSLIDYIMAVFTERKQALHDLVADTVVLPGTL
jgi:uncharacterized RDD family membrane protein YckC